MKRSLDPVYLFLACVLVITFITGCKSRHTVDGNPRLEFSLDSPSLTENGHWTAKGKRPNNHSFLAQVVEGQVHVYISTIFNHDLSPLWQTSQAEAFPIAFHQQAGSIVFSKDESDATQGSFTLQPDETFQQLIEALSGEPLTARQLLMCIIQKTDTQTLKDYQKTGIHLAGDQLWDWIRHNVSGKEVMSLKAQLKDLSATDVINLKRFGVKPDFVAKLSPKYPDYQAEDYTKIKRFGVNDSYALEVAESGHAFSSDDLIHLRRYGVPSDWPAACAVLEKIHGSDDLVSLRRYGVSLDFLKAAHASSAVQSAEDIVNLRRHGISTQFLNELNASTSTLSVDQIIQLRNAGVSADFFLSIQKIGGYSVDEIIQFRHRGVGIELIRAANPPDRPTLSAEAIMELKIRGVSPKSVGELRQ
jgi:hypothetical protein